ncbi:hypothetical protein BT96DRAFT_178651 [Gymnopus androsaceus JB14]|uniref:Uncharacterized protein n=1 Tax=Gymnopus androsaceus JB14 TaxID=1447944 RepID=A0A6A4HAF1_9AGAR|nr:hypothetical protein BT96DRAFT_178651 [Gymnopus androsaceus JB14]
MVVPGQLRITTTLVLWTLIGNMNMAGTRFDLNAGATFGANMDFGIGMGMNFGAGSGMNFGAGSDFSM